MRLAGRPSWSQGEAVSDSNGGNLCIRKASFLAGCGGHIGTTVPCCCSTQSSSQSSSQLRAQLQACSCARNSPALLTSYLLSLIRRSLLYTWLPCEPQWQRCLREDSALAFPCLHSVGPNVRASAFVFFLDTTKGVSGEESHFPSRKPTATTAGSWRSGCNMQILGLKTHARNSCSGAVSSPDGMAFITFG